MSLEKRSACQCEVSLFCASLIDQPWLHSRKHLPATRCYCKRHYYSWSLEKVFVCKDHLLPEDV